MHAAPAVDDPHAGSWRLAPSGREERVVPHQRVLFCVSDVIAGYRGHNWFAVRSTSRVQGAEATEQPDPKARKTSSRRTRRKRC